MYKRQAYKAEHEAELKQFYAARRRLTAEFPDGKVNMKKLSEEYDALVQTHTCLLYTSNFVGRFVPPAFGEVELTSEELEEIRKKEERKDRCV